MEGLIPFLLRAMKKHKPHQNTFRCLSDTSNRSYHMLLRAESIEGSSHRRARSEFQPPVTVDFLDLAQNRSFNNRASSLFSNQNSAKLTATSNLQGTTTAVDNHRHRKF
ncbi:hypothetical protein R3W88_003615 [Solanum pinnatisectum]|uniref:Uncharacterized protein n=1 Tax=Solanum pinnatisectum TaxID=50273 RepID=A0AAV9MQ73_9SOLN|nr:hypothetical protein R3W88_003615 [Solanum pinnatisectum]